MFLICTFINLDINIFSILKKLPLNQSILKNYITNVYYLVSKATILPVKSCFVVNCSTPSILEERSEKLSRRAMHTKHAWPSVNITTSAQLVATENIPLHVSHDDDIQKIPD